MKLDRGDLVFMATFAAIVLLTFYFAGVFD